MAAALVGGTFGVETDAQPAKATPPKIEHNATNLSTKLTRWIGRVMTGIAMLAAVALGSGQGTGIFAG